MGDPTVMAHTALLMAPTSFAFSLTPTADSVPYLSLGLTILALALSIVALRRAGEAVEAVKVEHVEPLAEEVAELVGESGDG